MSVGLRGRGRGRLGEVRIQRQRVLRWRRPGVRLLLGLEQLVPEGARGRKEQVLGISRQRRVQVLQRVSQAQKQWLGEYRWAGRGVGRRWWWL